MKTDKFLALQDEKSAVFPRPCCRHPNTCCSDCLCGCQSVRHHMRVASNLRHGSETSRRPNHHQPTQPFLPVRTSNTDMSSYSTQGSMSLRTSELHPESLPFNPPVVAPSMDYLSHSPAHRTSKQMARERTQEFINDTDDGRLFLTSPSQPVNSASNTDPADFFDMSEMSESMHVSPEPSDNLQSLLYGYESMFNRELPSNGIVVGAGAGFVDLNQSVRRLSTCRHGILAHSCTHCRSYSS